MSKQTEKQTPMEKAIEDVGGQVDNTPEKKVTQPKHFADVNEKIDFYPDLDKVEFDAIQGQELIILEAKLIRDFDSKFGKHDFMIVRAAFLKEPDNYQEFTFGTSGMVLVKRIMKAQEERKLPLIGVIAIPKGKSYYDIN